MVNSTYDQSITVLDTISIGAKLGNEPTSFSNGNRVQVKLVKLINKYTYNMANMKCVFWDHTIQFWNDDGCFLQNISNSNFCIFFYYLPIFSNELHFYFSRTGQCLLFV